ncbi:NAD(P)-dependent dehydrogenase (short-subunit alcohol dehydrogenase family) [Luteibacter sp. Sphag1AF]|uniref:SDR family NAD(P)-dependent oxidoreductase n=1 Tax=Luteibacter sp. Sphag1AF TaxID=2587031 RepID=UPI00160E99C6|nr:SDR family oxidoreductase [Luteibacter sp. Sphag1AF]MBB3226502.1 NAD(P)-dependent dehydrogenase (short-subunit alcohol dehydrogenase family) [Luteibacter sp. Sphag1AF]
MSAFATYPSLIDKVVLITGGASGIGASFVEHFARQGAKVGFLDLDQPGGERLAATLADAMHPPRFVPCDLSDPAALDRAVTEVRSAFGPIGVLINNAANDVRHQFADTTPAAFDQSVATNLRHQYFATQAVLADMQSLGGGSVICLGSTGWMRKNAGYPMYAMAKAAISGFVNGMARELGQQRIRINCLVPGWVITEKQQRLWLDEEGEAEIRRVQCMPGHLLPEDLARAALFLAADDSRMCTGQNFIVDGGWA